MTTASHFPERERLGCGQKHQTIWAAACSSANAEKMPTVAMVAIWKILLAISLWLEAVIAVWLGLLIGMSPFVVSMTRSRPDTCRAAMERCPGFVAASGRFAAKVSTGQQNGQSCTTLHVRSSQFMLSIHSFSMFGGRRT